MVNKIAIPVILGLGVGALALILLTRKAEAAPAIIPVAEIPTIEDIMQAQSIAELNAYYNLIGELFIIGKLSHTEYMELYDAYQERWYQLVGVA